MPNSILWIGLVVLWVFVLFPILADRHPRIRQTTDAALATRVLHRGGSKRRTKSGPAAGHDSDPDYRPTRAHRKLSYSDDAEDRMTTPADENVSESDENLPARGEIAARTEDIPVAAGIASDSDITEAEFDDEPEFDENDAEFADADIDPVCDEIYSTDGDFADADAADDLTRPEIDDAEIATARTAAKRGISADDELVGERHTGASTSRNTPARAMVPARYEGDDDLDFENDEFDSMDPDFVPTRRGRGGFDPEADAIARAARYTFRQRAVLGLILGAIAFGGLGVAISAQFWSACALSIVVLAAYLAYLRKQVRMEEEIRRRRLARFARARGQHIDEDDRRAEQRSQQRMMDRDTARALRRRSALLEFDDEDPMFEHLETFDAATARAVRTRAGDMRRAAGA